MHFRNSLDATNVYWVVGGGGDIVDIGVAQEKWKL